MFEDLFGDYRPPLGSAIIDAYNKFIKIKTQESFRLEDIFSSNFVVDFEKFLLPHRFGNLPYMQVQLATLEEKIVEEKESAENFVNFFKNIPNLVAAKEITNVGTGEIGVEAFAIKNFVPSGQLTAVDPSLILYPESVKTLMKVKHEMFESYNTAGPRKGYDLKGTDVVLAARPCESAEHIIRQCTKQKKAFFVLPCGCPFKTHNGDMLRNWVDQNNYLVSLDPSTKIVIPNDGNNTDFVAITNMRLREKDYHLAEFEANKNKALSVGMVISSR